MNEKLEKRRRRGSPSPSKAREILHDGTVHGKPLTDKQRRFMGAMSHDGESKKHEMGESHKRRMKKR